MKHFVRFNSYRTSDTFSKTANPCWNVYGGIPLTSLGSVPQGHGMDVMRHTTRVDFQESVKAKWTQYPDNGWQELEENPVRRPRLPTEWQKEDLPTPLNFLTRKRAIVFRLQFLEGSEPTVSLNLVPLYCETFSSTWRPHLYPLSLPPWVSGVVNVPGKAVVQIATALLLKAKSSTFYFLDFSKVESLYLLRHFGCFSLFLCKGTGRKLMADSVSDSHLTGGTRTI